MKLSKFLTFASASAALLKRDETTTASVPGSTVSTVVAGAKTDISVDGITTEVVISGTTTTWTATDEDTSTELVISGATTALEFSGTTAQFTLTASTTVVLEIADISTDVVFGDASTAVIITGTTSTATVTGSTTAELTIEGVTSSFTDSGTTFTMTSGEESLTTTIEFAGTTYGMTIDGVGSVLSLEDANAELGVDGVEVVLTATSSSEESSSTTEESSSTTDESSTSDESSSTTEESSSAEESTTSEESSTTEESTSSTEESSSTSEESSTTSEESTSSTEESTTSVPTAEPTTYPTHCEVVRSPLTPEEEIQLQVLFSDRAGASAFADYVVSYASQLIAQIDSVANDAVGDNNYAFTTAFDTIDIPGVLGLASAAPIYTCFLSSLWAQALANPQQYAKRATPTEDEKIKLIVLFEKRESDGMQFDYAELLVDETNDLIAEVKSVSAAAANGDIAAYASLFANVDVPYFLSIATEAPIYTEGLSAAIQTALASYNQTRFAPTTVTATTRTFITVDSYVTNYVSDTVTVPTTVVTTNTIVVKCDTVCVTTTVLPPDYTVRTTTVRPATEPPRVTTETVTLGNGRVEARTVTIRVDTRRPDVVESTRRPNVAVYTQVQNGVTYTHTIEIQTKNAAFKKAAALGAGLMGAAALLL